MSSRFFEEEDLHTVAQIKRFMEKITMVPGAREAYEENPARFLQENGIPFSREELQYEMEDPLDLRSARAVHPGSAIEKYLAYNRQKLDWRDEMRAISAPSDPTMKKWRERQIIRCEGAFGYRNHSYIHTVLTLELTEGCSVGCAYCGLNAGKLTGIYRATPEHLQEWREILESAREIMGEGAGCGTCYYATEPLDNPDYEQFAAVYRQVFGRFPQVTTAAALRDKERTRALLKEMTKAGDTIYRFSVQSLEQLREIWDSFTPEELILTELLPQYPEAPKSHFVKSGRNGGEAGDEDFEGTISCVSGFVVNMQTHTIRLETPVPASRLHPTGEAILARAHFDGPADFAEKTAAMIRDHMKLLMSPREKVQLYPYFDYEITEQYAKIISKEQYVITYERPAEIQAMKELLPLLKEGNMTRRELVACLQKDPAKWGAEPAFLFSFLNFYWKQGLLVDHDIYPE